MPALRTSSLRAAAAILAVALAACSTSPIDDQPAARVRIGAATAGAYGVELWTAGGFAQGLNPVWLKVTSGSTPITDAEVTFDPLMTMSSATSVMTHGCPVLHPPALDADGLYRTDVVFSMASSPPMNTWDATVTVKRPADPAASGVTFDGIPVAAVSGRVKSKADGMTKFVVSLNYLSAPRMGVVPVAVTIHKSTDMMMTFDPVTAATVHLMPYMPGMGHGGGMGGADPEHAASVGRYDGGKLSFTMDGDWVTSVYVTTDGHAPFDVAFPVSLH